MKNQQKTTNHNPSHIIAVILSCCGLFVAAAVMGSEAGQSKSVRYDSTPLLSGWHDEFNSASARDWQWTPPLGHADVSAPRKGVLRLTLGDRAQADGHSAKTYYWAAAARYANVDLDLYPILAVRVLALHGPSTWWDVTVNEYLGGEQHGPDRRAALKSATKPGLLLFDVAQAAGLTGKKQLRIRLNVAGLEKGDWAEYAYVRFLRREDVKRLEQKPDTQTVVP